jgi:hypothetical protein
VTFTETLSTIFDSNSCARRRLWSTRIFVGLEEGKLCIKGYSSAGPDDGKWHPWVITEEDYFAEDWEVVE